MMSTPKMYHVGREDEDDVAMTAIKPVSERTP